MEKFGVKIKGIVKNDDEFLIVKKWYDDRIEEPYQWEFIDCDLEEGERPESQCIGSVNDKTGVNVSSIELAYSWIYKLGDDNYLGLAFLCNVDDDIVILSEDLHEHKWVTADEIRKYITNTSLLKDMESAGMIYVEK